MRYKYWSKADLLFLGVTQPAYLVVKTGRTFTVLILFWFVVSFVLDSLSIIIWHEQLNVAYKILFFFLKSELVTSYSSFSLEFMMMLTNSPSMKALKVGGGCVDVGMIYRNVSHDLVTISVNSLLFVVFKVWTFVYGDIQIYGRVWNVCCEFEGRM